MTPPTNVGPYAIEREIGRGGMGVVYLARDTRLGRAAAVKCVPDHLADDPDRLARFEREARILASLQHPGIAGVYTLEEHAGRTYLAMEHVPGETLETKLRRGRLPVEESIEIAIRIAEALEAAHEKGVVHRDLKPGNVMVAPGGAVKVLDFGLARTADDAGPPAPGPEAPTLKSPASPTIAGAIMGTAGYMSPEQARGRPVDRRSDIFSFGCVLYAMLTGTGPFEGESVHDSVGAVLHKPLDLAPLPAATPALVRAVLERCLQRDRALRLRDIGDARLELQAALREPGAGSTPARGARLPTALAAALPLAGAVLGGALVWLAWPRGAPSAGVTRFEIDVQRDGALQVHTGPCFALSTDGRRFAYILAREGAAALYVRDVDKSESRLVASGLALDHPFFSPDGAWIGYFSDHDLMKVASSGGSPIALAPAVGGRSRGGAWGPGDVIVFAPDTTGPLLRVSAAGGPAAPVTTLDDARRERSHRWPAFVPGRADRVVFTCQTVEQDFDRATVEMVDLSSGTRRVLAQNAAYGRVTAAGHLLFAHNGSLFARDFPEGAPGGGPTPVPVVSDMAASVGNGGAQFAISDTGVLIYAAGAAGGAGTCVPTWVDFKGVETPLFPEPAHLFAPAISPDGTRVAFQAQYGDAIAMYEVRRGVVAPLYPTGHRQVQPIWSPDGTRIVFAGSTEDHFVPSLMMISSSGETPPERLATAGIQEQFPSDWSRDGTAILFDAPQPTTQRDIMVYRTDSRAIETLIATPGNDTGARLSTDGRWIAYESDVSGRTEIYLRRFDGAGGRLQLSVDGGRTPRWAPDGSSVFYVSERRTATGRTGKLLRVALDFGVDPPAFGAPDPVVELKPNLFSSEYDLDPSGERILILKWPETGAAGAGARVHLVINWFEELDRILAGGAAAR